MLSNPAAQEDSQVTPEGLQLTEVVFVVRHVIGNPNYPTNSRPSSQHRAFCISYGFCPHCGCHVHAYIISLMALLMKSKGCYVLLLLLFV